MKSEINSIFPTPIYFSKLDRKLSTKELLFVEKNKNLFFKNEGNLTSLDNYVLNKKEFKDLKKEIDLRIKDYFNKIIMTSNNVTPYITQSWLNYTETNQYHHKHEHPNSLVSGVFYINCNEKFDKINFYKKDNYSTIKLETKEWNLWNSSSWWFSVKTGNIILFPSHLTHAVETKQGDNTRTSLAFNVFVKGTLGDNRMLTEICL
jgi:uncharacterized protein (TIGR02466 family)